MRKQFTIIFVLLCLSCSGQNSPSFEETMEWLKGKFEVPLLRHGSATYPSFNYDGCNIIYSHRYRDNINPGSYVNGLIMTWKFSLKDIKSFKVYYDKGMFYNKVQFVVFNDRPLIVNSLLSGESYKFYWQ